MLQLLYLDFTLGKQYIGFVILGILSAFLFGIAIIYTYPLLARYENKLLKTIRNSMRIAMRYFGRTIFLVVVLVIEYIIFFRFTKITLLIGILVGPATMILTVSGFAMYFFREIEKAGGATTKKTEEDLYNEEIERETRMLLKLKIKIYRRTRINEAFKLITQSSCIRSRSTYGSMPCNTCIRNTGKSSRFG